MVTSLVAALLASGACARGDRSVKAVAAGTGETSGDRARLEEDAERRRTRPVESDVTVFASADTGIAGPVLRAFERREGIRVHSQLDSTAGPIELAEQVASVTSASRADVLWSQNPLAAMLLVRRRMVALYSPPSAASIPSQFKASDGSWTGFAARGRILLVNTQIVPADRIPASIHDLTDPFWRGRIAMADPRMASAAIHVAAWATTWGDDSAVAFIEALHQNRVRIAASEREVARLVSSGEVAFGLTDTDQAGEALASGLPVRVVYPDQEGIGVLLIPSVALLLEGARHPDAARRLLDYLVSDEGEQRIAQLTARLPLGSSYNHTPGLLGIDQIRTMPVDYAQLALAVTRIQARLRVPTPR